MLKFEDTVLQSTDTFQQDYENWCEVKNAYKRKRVGNKRSCPKQTLMDAVNELNKHASIDTSPYRYVRVIIMDGVFTLNFHLTPEASSEYCSVYDIVEQRGHIKDCKISCDILSDTNKSEVITTSSENSIILPTRKRSEWAVKGTWGDKGV